MTTTERIRNHLTNHIMPSQSNDMLGYEVYDNTSHITCSEGEPLFQEETGKYDLDTVSVFVAKLYQYVILFDFIFCFKTFILILLIPFLFIKN